MKRTIKGWSKKQKECNSVYAVTTGCPVSWSSIASTRDIHYQLDYNLHSQMGWCPQKAQKGEWIQVSKEEPSMWTDIIIQGRGDFGRWITGFKVAYTLRGHEWKLADNGRIF